jgi:copper homeostasis protein CutC
MFVKNPHSPRPNFLIEACVSTIEDAILAAQNGAHRLEISAALETDGVTPSLGMLKEIVAAVHIPVVTLIRIRSGHFVYDDHEIRAMLADAQAAIECGSVAIAVGCLTPIGGLDIPAMQLFADRIGGERCVCHRAFDQSHDQITAAKQLIEIGYQRILTSGGAPSAVVGISQLQRLQKQCGTQIEILPAGGIHPDNIIQVLEQTGCTQVHGSFRRSGLANSAPRLDRGLLAEARNRLEEQA